MSATIFRRCRPTEGRVLFADRELYGLSPDARSRIRAEGIGFVFQQFHLVPYLTVMEDILVPSMARPDGGAVDRAKALIDREPTGNLDETNGEAELACLAEYARDGGAVLLATHNVRAGRHAHRIIQMAGGRLLL